MATPQAIAAAATLPRACSELAAGMATPRHTPLGRGYSSMYGYYQHANDYWTKGEGEPSLREPQRGFEATGEVDVCLNHFTDLSEANATYFGGVRLISDSWLVTV